MKHVIALLATLVAAIPAFGHEITGKVLGENNTPLEFASVVLYRDSTYITGAITDTCGNMGEITLSPSAVELGEVVVKATRPSTTMKGIP